MNEINEDLPHFITVENDNTTMKTILTSYGAKDNTELKFDDNLFFHTILEIPPHMNKYTDGAYKIDKMISITTMEKSHLNCDFFHFCLKYWTLSENSRKS